MSLRLITKTRRTHTLSDGRIISQMMGAEGEGEETEGDIENDTDADETEDDEDDKSKSDKGSEDDPEKERLKNRMKAADRRAAAAEAKLREKELEGKSELEQIKAKLEQEQATNEELNGRIQELTRERAFLGSNTVTWHDPEMAMSKLSWDDIIDEDGNADSTALERAIKDLAKRKPFLVKKDVVENDEDNKPGERQRSAPGNPGSGKKQTKAELDRAALEKKYPALRT